MIQVFKDQSLQEHFEEHGYVTIPFLEAEALANLTSFSASDLEYKDQGFYHVFLNNDLALRNKVVDVIKSQFETPMKEIFHESTIVYGSFTIKEPGPAGVKGSHQDWTLTDESAYPSMTLWCPLADVDVDNGCLGVLKGSHKFALNIRGVNTPSEYADIAKEVEEDHMTFIPMKAGEAIIFSSSLLHYSPENKSQNARLAAACVFVPKENPSLRMYYKDEQEASSKLEIFEVQPEYLIERDYFNITRPKDLKSLGQIDYNFKMLTQEELHSFISKRGGSPKGELSKDIGSPTLNVVDLSKQYFVGDKPKGLFSIFSNNGKGNKGEAERENWALNKVTFSLNRGDVLGLFGPNGSGKSTLLKVLSEVTKPTGGLIEYQGKLMAILELGTGFHPDLTGSENIYFNGRLLGMSKADIQSRYEEIVAFSGIGDYINSPVKYYSSGMYSRLAFSVFAHMEPDILLLDEIFSTGDEEFRDKSSKKILEMADRGTTIILVSHNMDELFTVCNRYALMENGVFSDLGSSTVPVYEYLKSLLIKRSVSNISDSTDLEESKQLRLKEWDVRDTVNTNNEQICLTSMSVRASEKDFASELLITDSISIELIYKLIDGENECQIAFALLDIFNHELFGDSTFFHVETNKQLKSGDYKVTWQIPGNILNSGTYKLNLRIKSGNRIIVKLNEVVQFEVVDHGSKNTEPNYRYPIKINSTLGIEELSGGSTGPV